MVYIYFTIAEATDFLNCSPDKAVRVFKELETVNKTGLIERKSQGNGKPAIVYVKKIITKIIIYAKTFHFRKAISRNIFYSAKEVRDSENKTHFVNKM